MNAAWLLYQPWVARAGWALLHFLWQGALIALLFAVVRALAGSSLTPRGHYALACVALGIMMILPPLTFLAAGGVASDIAIASTWPSSSRALELASPWVVAGWLFGAIVCSLRLLGAWRFTKVLRTVAVVPPPREWQETLNGLIDRIGASRPVRLLASSLAEVPMVVGWLRPVVLMPMGMLAGMPLDQVEALLAHELAHIWRNDYLVNVLQCIGEAMLFYHPAVWWVSKQIRIERELCCDDVAVNASGDVLVYVRALTNLETHRRARLNAVMAADGGSLVSRVRRLIAEPQPVRNNLPVAGTAWALSLLWLAAMGTATVHGAPDPVKPLPAPPPVVEAPAMTPLVNALLFDPAFAPPQVAGPTPTAARPVAAQPAPARQAPRGAGGMRATSVKLVYIPETPDAPEQPLTLSGSTWNSMGMKLFLPLYEGALNSGSPVSLSAIDTPSLFSTSCPVLCAEFETWVEGLAGDYVESISTDLSGIEREHGKTTLQRFVGDDKRHVYVTYKATVETLEDTGTYRVTFAASEPSIPSWVRPPADAKVISPPGYPAPQIVRDGDTLSLELYADATTSQRVVDYIHMGQHKPILLRTETARESFSDNAGFTLVQPGVSVNGVAQELAALPETTAGPVLWVYVPGHGRYVLSFKPHSDLGFEDVGEVTGNSLTFAADGNVFRIEGAERIASAGSGVYRVHVLRDAAWEPVDAADQGRAMIGASPSVETAVRQK